MENKLKKYMDGSVQEPPVNEMKKELEEHTTVEKYRKLKKNQEEMAKQQTVSLKSPPQDYFDKLDMQHKEMVDSKNKNLPFITHKLTDFVPFHYPSLILIGAPTGLGKSTATANIVYRLFKNNMKSLVISNEELALSVYNRIACIDLGLSSKDVQSLSPKDQDMIAAKRREIGKYLSVVDLNYDNNPNFTSSVEGIEAIFESILRNQDEYDCIVIDYYQNISKSKRGYNKQKYEVLTEVKELLDKYYKILKCPIVVFAQLHPNRKEDISFESRIKEGKSIIVAATFVMELVTDPSARTTIWKCHKDRFTDKREKQVVTDYEMGKYKDSK